MKVWKIQPPTLLERDHNPVVDQLLDIIKEQNRRIDLLADEIKRLKDLKNKPKLKPSKLRDSEKKKSQSSDKKSNPKQSSQSHKKNLIDRTEFIKQENIPEGSRFKGYRDYRAQELVIRVENILYKLERWQLPDGIRYCITARRYLKITFWLCI